MGAVPAEPSQRGEEADKPDNNALRKRFPEGASQRGAAAAAVTHREQCRQADAAVLPLVLTLHGQGLSLRGIAAALEAAAIPTRQGFRHWHARQVARILARAAAVEATPQTPSAVPANPSIS